jgi:hypothetical protein
MGLALGRFMCLQTLRNQLPGRLPSFALSRTKVVFLQTESSLSDGLFW